MQQSCICVTNVFYFCLMRLKINWDALGITASVACAIHCALLPVFITSLPLFGVDIIDNKLFEIGMIALAAAIGSYSLYHGYKKHHHQILPLVIFGLGIGFLVAKQIWHEQQLWLLAPAVALIVGAHYINYKSCKKASHCHAEDCAH